MCWAVRPQSPLQPTGSSSRRTRSSSLRPRRASRRLLPPADDSRFLKACRCERADVTPVWFMRQAGRYLAEYRALRQKHSLLELCRRPDLAAEVTLQPVERLGVDAAILFADILLPFEPLGLGLTFADGDGPHISRPIHEASQVLELPRVDPATDLAYVMDARQLED